MEWSGLRASASLLCGNSTTCFAARRVYQLFRDIFLCTRTQALLLGGIGEAGNLPQNLRIISNFFRTAPDGTVRAFSQPIVHER